MTAANMIKYYCTCRFKEQQMKWQQNTSFQNLVLLFSIQYPNLGFTNNKFVYKTTKCSSNTNLKHVRLQTAPSQPSLSNMYFKLHLHNQMFIQYRPKACTAFFVYLIQLDLRLFALQVFLRKKCQGFINKKSYFFNNFFSLLVWELDCNVVYLKHCLFSLGAIQMKMDEWC